MNVLCEVAFSCLFSKDMIDALLPSLKDIVVTFRIANDHKSLAIKCSLVLFIYTSSTKKVYRNER